MMQLSDWISGAVGLIVFLLGFLPLMKWFNTDFLPLIILTWIVALAGLYLLVDAIVEITNSNIIGWITFWVAAAAMIIGLFPILHSFGIGPLWFEFRWLSRAAYHFVFIIEGVFLIIATFAREL